MVTEMLSGGHMPDCPDEWNHSRIRAHSSFFTPFTHSDDDDEDDDDDDIDNDEDGVDVMVTMKMVKTILVAIKMTIMSGGGDDESSFPSMKPTWKIAERLILGWRW